MSTQPLYIKATEDTPEVTFEPVTGRLLISGRSLPENAYAFYRPVIDWAKAYLGQSNSQTEITISLDYFNSSSGRFLLEFFSVFEEKLNDRNKVKVIWCSEHDDELMLEKGEEFKNIVDLPFEIKTF